MRSLRFDAESLIDRRNSSAARRDRFGFAFLRQRLIRRCAIAGGVVALCSLLVMTSLGWEQLGSLWTAQQLLRLGMRLTFLLATCLFIAFAAALIFYLSACKMISDLSAKIRSMRTISSDMGHELSSPLSSLIFRLRMLQDQALTDEVKTHVRIANEACSRIATLVGECRALGSYDDVSRAQLSIIRFDHLVRNTVADMQVLFKSRDMHLEIGTIDAATVMGDREGLTRVITNLLSNALRYGKPHGSVCVCLLKEARAVRLMVRDDGEGIASGELPHLFERYYRAHRSEDTEGSGLGLAIVKAVVDAHGGKITVTSELGQFTEFEVTIPKLGNQIFMRVPLIDQW